MSGSSWEFRSLPTPNPGEFRVLRSFDGIRKSKLKLMVYLFRTFAAGDWAPVHPYGLSSELKGTAMHSTSKSSSLYMSSLSSAADTSALKL